MESVVRECEEEANPRGDAGGEAHQADGRAELLLQDVGAGLDSARGRVRVRPATAIRRGAAAQGWRVLVIRKQRACPSERGKVKDETLGRSTMRERGGQRVRKPGEYRHAVTEAMIVRHLRVGQRRHTWRALIHSQSFQGPNMRSANRPCGNCVSLRKVPRCAVCLRLPLHSVSMRKLGSART
ncbi:hypothetical protein L1887_41921 [Cichorium endivia]|nr:hypothetical protein L1887_41921 [Cichorium endivia]